MRLVRCTVPLERSDLVVHALQSLGLCHSVTRSNGEQASVITACVPVGLSSLLQAARRRTGVVGWEGGCEAQHTTSGMRV